MAGVSVRHIIGAALGALAAFVVIVALLAAYSLLSGASATAPFEGSHTIGPFSGSMGTMVLVFLDFLIPLVAGLGFVVALSLVSRTKLSALAFTTKPRAMGEGAMLGVAVFVLLYVPVLYVMAHPTGSQAVQPLVEGIIDHLAFGSVIGLIVFLVGGPVPVPATSPTELPPRNASPR